MTKFHFHGFRTRKPVPATDDLSRYQIGSSVSRKVLIASIAYHMVLDHQGHSTGKHRLVHRQHGFRWCLCRNNGHTTSHDQPTYAEYYVSHRNRKQQHGMGIQQVEYDPSNFHEPSVHSYASAQLTFRQIHAFRPGKAFVAASAFAASRSPPAMMQPD